MEETTVTEVTTEETTVTEVTTQETTVTEVTTEVTTELITSTTTSIDFMKYNDSQNIAFIALSLKYFIGLSVIIILIFLATRAHRWLNDILF